MIYHYQDPIFGSKYEFIKEPKQRKKRFFIQKKTNKFNKNNRIK